MNIRHLSYFVALAREEHHGRAARACNVTQSTLSEAVRQLERELKSPLIRRSGARYGGLTEEGQRALIWAKRLIADQEALEQELRDFRNELSGPFHFGVIPAAMATAPLLTGPFCKAHPQVTLTVRSLTSVEIQAGIASGSLHAGLTYLDNEPISGVKATPLYRERYMLLTPPGGKPDGKSSTASSIISSITWREAAQMPLCLLTTDMQNRRIIDRLFREGGAGKPRVAVETNSILSLIAHVSSGGWSSIIPHTFLSLVGSEKSALGRLKAIPLTKPDASQSVGIVVDEREPLSPLARAFLKTAKSVDVIAELRRIIPSGPLDRILR